MNEETKELKTGDIIYLKSRYGIETYKAIDRVTNTVAFAGNKKFKKSYNLKNSLYEIGRTDKWSISYWYMETPKLKNEFFRQNTIESIKTHSLFKNIQKLTNKELQGLLDHMDNLNKQF